MALRIGTKIRHLYPGLGKRHQAYGYAENAMVQDRSDRFISATNIGAWRPVARVLTLAAWILITVASCGGGGGGGAGESGDTSVSPSPIPPVLDTPTGGNGEGTPDDSGGSELMAAARLGSRATFGADLGTIQRIENLGAAAWLEEQFEQPISSHDAIVTELLTREANGEFLELARLEDADNLSVFFGRMAWWQTSITAQDQLRQRVAYALSQIFVISDEVNALLLAPYGTSNFYDTLLMHAFGNYRDLLLAVTLHPSMGLYLSHLNNAKGDEELGTFPDENYAREVMQLFSIGLFELNPDGSEVIGDNGQPIPSYDNGDIGEFARVFTGLSWGGDNPRFGSNRRVFNEPMQVFEAFHDAEEKTLLRGEVLPAGQSGMSDIEAAVDNLFWHPNTGPFISKQLIQRLVTSNPSLAYVERASKVFADNGNGERGDMQALIRAVLLDPEALAAPGSDVRFGKLREPLLRYTAMLRQLGVSAPDGFYANTGRFVQDRIQQHALSAPSVFNFYLPSHSPVGAISAEGLVAPEFQITNSNSVIQISNLIQASVLGNLVNDINEPPFSRASLTLGDFLPVASDSDALLDRLDLLFTYGTLSSETRRAIHDLVVQIDDEELRVRAAAYLLLISPDYAVEL